MPTIDVSYEDLCKLSGKKIPIDKLQESLLYAKSELEGQDGDTIKLDVKDTNRPDLWSTEGVAREIAGRQGKSGMPKFGIKDGKEVVKNDTKSPVQPVAVCAIARGLKIDEAFLSQIIQLQEKMAVSFGRNRKGMSMGIYDMEKMKFPVSYTSLNKKKIKFRPLGFDKEMFAEEILKKHQKGREFSHLLDRTDEYPVWVDGNDKILSMPPIINSEDIGNVTTETKNVFIEITGYDLKFLKTAINVIAAQMCDRGAAVEKVTTINKGEKTLDPVIEEKEFVLDVKFINKVSGLGLDEKEILRLVEMARYDAKIDSGKLHVKYPSYRQDIMHASDVVEDIVISYGYNNIDAVMRPLATKGRLDRMQIFLERVHNICMGLGLQEILSYTLTNKDNLFGKMETKEDSVVEVDNPVSMNWSVFRTWLMPQILEFFSQNMHIDYPQKIFEIGICTNIDEKQETKTKDVTKLSIGFTASAVNYEIISSYLDAIMKNLGLDYQLVAASHESFIPGRCAEIVAGKEKLGVLGEIHPSVLSNWRLEKPVLVLEIDLDKIYSLKN